MESGDKTPLFILLADLADKDDAAPLSKHEGCWERRIGKDWWIAVNGHEEDKKCSRGAQVPFGHCYVEYLGFPAGLFSPFGGTIAAGAVANEEAFAKALEDEIHKEAA
jgi:hypothetical protein